MSDNLIPLVDYRLTVDDVMDFNKWLNDNGVRSRILSLGSRVMTLRGFNIHKNSEGQLVIPVTFKWYVDAYLSGTTLVAYRNEVKNA